jgi:hypothetical protein
LKSARPVSLAQAVERRTGFDTAFGSPDVFVRAARLINRFAIAFV